MATEVIVRETSSGVKNIFYTGNCVIHTTTALVVMVSDQKGSTDACFSGSVVNESSLPIKGAHRNRWLKNEFRQFTGEITIKATP